MRKQVVLILLACLMKLCEFLYAQHICNCHAGTCLDDETMQCSCYSGFAGQACETSAPTNCTFNTVDKLRTKYPFSMTSIAFTNNELHHVVLSPLVTNRLNSTIYYKGAEGISNCQYPGPNWRKNVDTCADSFVGKTRWITARQCGTWTYDNTSPDYTVFSNTLVVKSNELIPTDRGATLIRNLQYSFPVMVRFHKSAMISSSIRKYALPLMDAIITTQSVDVETNTGILELTTLVQWPFKYSNPTLKQVPSGFEIVSVSEVGSTFQCAANSDCTQVWRIVVPLDNNCVLNGDWSFEFSEICHSTYTQCPIPSSGRTANLFATVTTENFCGVSQVEKMEQK